MTSTTLTVPATWPLLVVGLILAIVYLRLDRKPLYTLGFVGILALLWFGLGQQVNWIFAGVLAGLLGAALLKHAFAIAGALLVVGGVWFVGLPYVLSQDTVQAMYQRSIHQDFLGFAKGNLSGLEARFADTKARARAGEMNQAEQASYGLTKGRSGWTDQQNELRAHLANQGMIFGDFGIPVTHAATADPKTWYNTGKQVCGDTRIKIWGKANSDTPENQGLDQWADARGWIPGLTYQPRVYTKNGTPHPYWWREFPKVWEDAPYMSVLVRVGLLGEVAWEWEPLDAASLTLDVTSDNGCQPLFMQVNDFTGFANGLQQPEMFARNKGTQPFAVGNLKTEGFQAELIER